MLKFSKLYHNIKAKELLQLEEKKAKVSGCLTMLEKKKAEHKINDSSKNKDYITYLCLIDACIDEIQLLEKEIEIKEAMVHGKRNVSEPDHKVSVGTSTLTTSVALPPVNGSHGYPNNNPSLGIALNLELTEALSKRKAKLEEKNSSTPVNSPHQQALSTESKENDLPKVVAVVPKITVPQKPSIEEYKPSIWQQPLWSPDNSAEVLVSERLSDLSVILEDEEGEDEGTGILRRLSVMGKEQLSNLRKSIASINSTWELALFEELEQKIAEEEQQQQNPEQESITDLSAPQFFKLPAAKMSLNGAYEPHNPDKRI